MGSDMCAHGSGSCACKDYGRPVVEEVREVTEGESIVSGLLPKYFEEFDRLAMGNDMK